jgi:hypothetical protein
VPDDGSLLFVLEAESLALVHRACAAASIAPGRVSVAVAEAAEPAVSSLSHTTSAPQESERSTRC